MVTARVLSELLDDPCLDTFIGGTPATDRLSRRQGCATEAAASMVQWLRAQCVDLVRAYIHSEHRARPAG